MKLENLRYLLAPMLLACLLSLGIAPRAKAAPCLLTSTFTYKCMTNCYLYVPQCSSTPWSRTCDLVSQTSCCNQYPVGVYGSNSMCASLIKVKRQPERSLLTKYAPGKTTDRQCQGGTVATQK